MDNIEVEAWDGGSTVCSFEVVLTTDGVGEARIESWTRYMRELGLEVFVVRGPRNSPRWAAINTIRNTIKETHTGTVYESHEDNGVAIATSYNLLGTVINR